MAVVKSGRKTASGKDIYVAAPTKTDVAREVAASRVQTFSGGTKLSDTQRVQVQGPEGTEFVTPERALATQKEGSIAYREAQQKQSVMEQQGKTIAARYEAQFNQKPETKQTIRERTELPIGALAGSQAGAVSAKKETKPQTLSGDAYTLNPYATSQGRSYPERPVKKPTVTSEFAEGFKETFLFEQPIFSSKQDTGLGLVRSIDGSKASNIFRPTKLFNMYTENIIDPSIERYSGTTTEKARQAGKDIGSVSLLYSFSQLPTALSGVRTGGEIIRGSSLATKVAQSGRLGKFVIDAGVGVTQVSTIYAGFQAGGNLLTRSETKDIISETRFQRDILAPAQQARTNLVEQEGFFSQAAFSLVPSAQPRRFKEAFSTEITKQSEALGFTPEETAVIQKRAARERRVRDIGLTTSLIGAEAFANLLSVKGGVKGFFDKGKIIPGFVEGAGGRNVYLTYSGNRKGLFPSLQREELAPAYNSIDDPNAITRYVSIGESDFNKLGIVEGQPLPSSFKLPENTNLVYQIVGQETKTTQLLQTDTGLIEFTTSETPIRELTLSTQRPAQKARFDPLTGRFAYKGEQFNFNAGRVIDVTAFGAAGSVTAGLFGGFENFAVRRFKRAGKPLTYAAGYGLDIAEGPGDIATPAFTLFDTRRAVTSNVITLLPDSSFARGEPSFAVTGSETFQKVSDKSVRRTQSLQLTRTQDFSLTGSIQETSTGTFNPISSLTNIFSPTNTPALSIQNTPSFNTAITNVNVPAITNVPTFTNTNTFNFNNALTNTNTFSNTFTNSLVFTPKLPIFPLPIDFFGGEDTGRFRRSRRKQTAYTPDFIASVLDEYGPAPRSKVFTGQERRYKIGRSRSTKRVKKQKSNGIFGMFSDILGG